MAARWKDASRFRTADANGGSKVAAELKAERLDLDAATAFARSLAGPQGGVAGRGAAFARYRPRHFGRPGAAAAGGPARLRPENVFARPVEYRSARQGSTLEGIGRFDRVESIGKLELNSSAASLGSAHQPCCAVCAIAGHAAQLRWAPSPGPARVKLDARLSTGMPGRPIAPMRAPWSISTRRSSRASPRSPRSRCLRRSTASISQALGRSELGIEFEAVVRAGPRLLALLGLDRVDRGRRGPGAIRGHGDRRMACAVAAESEDLGRRARCRRGRLGRAMGAGSQGQPQFEGSQRRSRAAARSQADGHAGAEYRPVVARIARRQQAGASTISTAASPVRGCAGGWR